MTCNLDACILINIFTTRLFWLTSTCERLVETAQNVVVKIFYHGCYNLVNNVAIPASSAPSERVFSTTKNGRFCPPIFTKSYLYGTIVQFYSRLTRPFVSYKFHHKRSILTTCLFLVYAWSVCACTLYGTASDICLQQIQLQCHHL